jgi:hypothetical protein
MVVYQNIYLIFIHYYVVIQYDIIPNKVVKFIIYFHIVLLNLLYFLILYRILDIFIIYLILFN